MNINDLGSQVSLIGQLLGLLNNNGGNISVNTDWFKDPISQLDHIPGRMNQVVRLVNSFLGDKGKLKTPPQPFAKAEWRAIPDPRNGQSTPLYFVSSPADSASGEIGLGLSAPYGVGNLGLKPYLYLPLFTYDNTGARFVAGGSGHPFLIGLYCTTADGKGFQVTEGGGSITFDALNIDAGIYFSATTPSFSLSFEKLKGASFTSPITTLAGMKNGQVIACIAEVALQADYWLRKYVGRSGKTIGDILVSAGLLTADSEENYHLNISNLQGSPLTIALNFAFAALDALAASEGPLIPLHEGGIYVQKNTDASQTNLYSLLFATDISFNLTPGEGGKMPPSIKLSLGSWMTGEDDDSNWIKDITGDAAKPGLSFQFLSRKGNDQPVFSPGFNMKSVGFDIYGGGGDPLINRSGYVLGGAEMRVSIDPVSKKHGFAIRLDNCGIPLGPTFSQAQSSGGNAVAKNLIASDGNDPAGSKAVNPTFSAKAGYIKSYSPYFRIYDEHNLAADTIWFPVQRRFGPVSCNKVGIKMNTATAGAPLMGIIFDGDVKLGMLGIYLDQLTINVPLKTAASISTYSLDLQGLGVSFNSSSVAITGALVKTKDGENNIIYNGEAILKFQNVMLTALGSYASLPNNGGTSLFVYAMLNQPLGGPAFFYVTGLSAGFGYNRALKLPDKDNVAEFPLLKGLMDPSAIGGGKDPVKALQKLSDWVPPQKGQYFLAAGVQFTTFEVLKTNAVMAVAFGNDLSVSILGVSTLRQPATGSNAYVYAQLGINAQFLPSKGEVKVSAILAPGSYVITPKAQLTGGFAFYSWFGDSPHAGDFVFTIGGYHPSFKKPAWYPDIPRVGINWQISSNLSMTGGAYFAITPSCMMAGGSLAINFDAGNLKAWFKASIDILLFFKPFYLIATASVSVGVSYRIHVLFVDVTLSVEIGADFSFYGPPVGGYVHIDWYVISFTISFGDSMTGPGDLDWTDFKGLLPKKPKPQTAPKALHAMAAVPAVADAPPQAGEKEAFVYITANDGLLSTQTVEGLTLWLVRADQLKFTAGSAIPNTKVEVLNRTTSGNVKINGGPVGMQKLYGGIAAANYKCEETIAIIKLSDDSISYIKNCMATSSPCTAVPASCKDTPVDLSQWQIEPVIQNLPSSIWGPVPSQGSPTLNTPDTTAAGTMGVRMSPKIATVTNCTPEMVIDQLFSDRVINAENANRMPLSQVMQPPLPPPQDKKSFTDIKKINELGDKRTAVFKALQSLGVNAWTNGPMTTMAGNPAAFFADEPLEGSPAILNS